MIGELLKNSHNCQGTYRSPWSYDAKRYDKTLVKREVKVDRGREIKIWTACCLGNTLLRRNSMINLLNIQKAKTSMLIDAVFPGSS